MSKFEVIQGGKKDHAQRTVTQYLQKQIYNLGTDAVISTGSIQDLAALLTDAQAEEVLKHVERLGKEARAVETLVDAMVNGNGAGPSAV